MSPSLMTVTEPECFLRTSEYSASIVSDRSEIAALSPFVREVVKVPGPLDPAVFLASVTARDWRPRVVVVRRDGEIVGLLYCKERLVGGIASRIVFGDDALGTMVTARAGEGTVVLHCGVRTLLRTMLGLRLIIRPAQVAVLQSAGGSADLDCRPATRHAHLELTTTYEELLGRFGSRTRRNLRYYRRKSEQAGYTFQQEIGFDSFRAAARLLRPKGSFRQSAESLDKYLGMIEAMSSRMLVGLKDRDGEWISLAGGWYADDRAVVLMQLNDKTYTRESISLVTRSYLMENLIGLNFRDLVFFGGTSKQLSSYCSYPDLSCVYMDDPSLGWRLGRRAISALGRVSSPRTREWLNWVVPDRQAQPYGDYVCEGEEQPELSPEMQG